jgi:nitrite reductase/ring-hydroxylating ferredoxin subunit
MRRSLSIVKKCGISEPDRLEGARYEISRRSFLGSTALVVLPALCGGCADDGVSLVELPAVSNKTIAISLDEFPMLKNVGGSIVGQASGLANPIVIARVSDNMFAALDAICTHERCTVSYNALNLTLDCPCHGSSYEVDGRVINGPAVRALPRYTATSDGTTLTVTLP